jgi:hypothetical protein
VLSTLETACHEAYIAVSEYGDGGGAYGYGYTPPASQGSPFLTTALDLTDPNDTPQYRIAVLPKACPATKLAAGG